MRGDSVSLLFGGLLAVMATELVGCDSPPAEPADAGLAPFYVSGIEFEKARLYNLVGRWYPDAEVERLRDPTLTPEEWCAREPVRLFVHQDQVEVFCEKASPKRASIARVKTSSRAGDLTLLLRASKDSPLRALRFETSGPNAVISGSPCFGGKATRHQRFPEYEILTRQILGGRRCSQVLESQSGLSPTEGTE